MMQPGATRLTRPANRLFSAPTDPAVKLRGKICANGSPYFASNILQLLILLFYSLNKDLVHFANAF